MFFYINALCPQCLHDMLLRTFHFGCPTFPYPQQQSLIRNAGRSWSVSLLPALSADMRLSMLLKAIFRSVYKKLLTIYRLWNGLLIKEYVAVSCIYALLFLGSNRVAGWRWPSFYIGWRWCLWNISILKTLWLLECLFWRYWHSFIWFVTSLT